MTEILKNFVEKLYLNKNINILTRLNFFYKDKFTEKKIKIFQKKRRYGIPIVDDKHRVIKIYKWDYFFKEIKNKNFPLPGDHGRRQRNKNETH